MIRMIASTSAGHAKAYFTDALLKSDYYLDDQELQGKFHGRLAERLGVAGPATKDVFFALCENRHPETGQPLTPRTKQNRTIGYDINFHVPKSVSVLHALSKDNHILDAFEASVNETMRSIEKDCKTRVRKNGKSHDRKTSEMVWASFVHQTARPVEGHLPDPHLHAHCFVFNSTFDPTENKIKAGQFRDIMASMPFYKVQFHKRFSDKLIDLGYSIRVTDKAFEIEGVPKGITEMFSKRTNEIGQVAKEKGITDAKELSELGARTRAKKQKGLSMDELREGWKKQIHEFTGYKDGEMEKTVRRLPDKQKVAEPEQIQELQKEQIAEPLPEPEKQEYNSKNINLEKNPLGGIELPDNYKPKDPAEAAYCLDYALMHCFERASVVEPQRILETAFRYTLGRRELSMEDVVYQLQNHKEIIPLETKNRTYVTTKEVLKEEQEMVSYARKAQDKFSPLYTELPELKSTGEHAAAIAHVLTTKHGVSIIKGGAGTGKTTMMKEVVELVGNTGFKLTAVTPGTNAARQLHSQIGVEGKTVARLLVDTKMQEELKGQVLLVDEAGMLGTRDMRNVLSMCHDLGARLILSGDTRQHTSVVRGDALRVLNTVAHIDAAHVTKIYRQKHVQYKEAVQDLSNGDVAKAFTKMEAMGAIKEIDGPAANKTIVADYISAVKKGKTVLIVSPTHKQGDAVTEALRNSLRESKLLGKKEVNVKRYKSLNLTEAEKSNWRNFQEGHVVQFNQNTPQIKRGSLWTVANVDEDNVRIKNKQGEERYLPLGKSKTYDLYEETTIGLSKGDKVQVTRGGNDANKMRLDNGMEFEVASVTKKGDIHLVNTNSKTKYVLDKDYGHINHAFVCTSQASQGKTVDEVFISQPAATFGATNKKQFYVSVSRGRDMVTIYTDDKQDLLDNANRLGDRHSAMELMQGITGHAEYVQGFERANYNSPITDKSTFEKDHSFTITKTRDYEPEL